MDFIQNVDFSILYWIQDSLRCVFLDVVLPFLTNLCNNGEIWIVCGVVLHFFRKYRRFGIFLLFAMLMGSVIGNDIIKPLVQRARPCHIDEAVELLVKRPSSFSFPSGHTCSSIVAATVLTRANKKFGYAAIPVAILIAFSRLYVFVHFPTDVLAGALLGFTLGFLTVTFGNKLFDRFGLLPPNMSSQKTESVMEESKCDANEGKS